MKIFRVFVIIIICALAILPTSNGVAFAATNVYSDVLEDLQKDESFDKNDYPINQTDYSLELIQIAESYSGELLVYVYQPSAGAKGILTKKIRIKYPNSDTYNDYDLTLLSKNGVFYKYKVDGYVTDYDSATERVYNVVQIMRSASAELGDKVLDENNNTISYVPYPVNWTFTAKYNEGELYYGKEKLESVVITDKYCGQLRFTSDDFTRFAERFFLGIGEKYTTLHFIAFNTDAEIEDLVAAKVSFDLKYHKRVYQTAAGDTVEADEYSSESKVVSLSKEAEVTYKGGLFGHKYSWSEIMSVEDFCNDVVISSTAFFKSDFAEGSLSEVNNKKWVLCYYSTEYIDVTINPSPGVSVRTVEEYATADTSILELTVNRNGVLYTLGVVDNYQTGDGIPDNKEDYGVNEEWWANWWNEMQEWLRYILIAFAGVLLVVVLIFICPPIFKVIKFIFRIITAPFRALFRSSSRRNNNSRR